MEQLRNNITKRATVKKWYTSKTLWVNVIALAGAVGQELSGHGLLSAETQIALLGLINIILRLATNKSIKW